MNPAYCVSQVSRLTFRWDAKDCQISHDCIVMLSCVVTFLGPFPFAVHPITHFHSCSSTETYYITIGNTALSANVL